MRFLLLIPLLLAAGCTETIFEEIGDGFGAPIAVTVDAANNRAYVVNSNILQEFDGASLSVLDITDPTAPVLLASDQNPVAIADLSGQIYLDAATGTAYLTNRRSDNTDDTVDALLRITLDEGSAAFGTVESFNAGTNPFGISCCDAAGRIYVVSNGGTVDVFAPADLSTFTQVSLAVTLSEGSVSGRSSTEGVHLGDQFFVTNRAGRIYVINTTEVGDTSKNPIDYVLLSEGSDFRGIATDGTLLYVVDDHADGPLLRIVDPSSLTAVDPDTASLSEVELTSILVTNVTIGENPNEVASLGTRVAVSNRDDDTVTIVDTTSNSVAATVTVGEEPYGLAAFTSGGTDFLYVTNLAGNSLSIVNLGTSAVVSTFSP